MKMIIIMMIQDIIDTYKIVKFLTNLMILRRVFVHFAEGICTLAIFETLINKGFEGCQNP